MRVAVITPYYRESESILRQCHESVLAQQHPCEHILVADGHAQTAIDNWQGHHITLPLSHDDNGNTPRCIGSLFAMNQGFEAIAYLDADNWYQPEHIASLVALHHEQGADACFSGRSLHRTDGSFIPMREGPDGQTYVDTSCMFLTRNAFQLCTLWALMPPMLSPICDRLFHSALVNSGLKLAHSDKPTLAFRSQYAMHYEFVGEAPPEGAKTDVAREPIEQWKALDETERDMYFRRLGFRFNLG